MRAKPFRVVVWLAVICALFLLSRLFYMQITNVEAYREKAGGNLRLFSPVMAGRGMIYDRNGQILARNEAIFTIQMAPYKSNDPVEVLTKVSKVIPLSEAKYKKLAEILRKNSELDNLTIAEGLDKKAVARFVEVQERFPSLRLEVKSKRIYPVHDLAAHIVGYVGEIDAEHLERLKNKGYIAGEWIGRDGVEMSHEAILHGCSGLRLDSVDMLGRTLNTSEQRSAVPGGDIYLSIDLRLQRYTEDVLYGVLNRLAAKNGERSGGAVVAMEPNTGLIRALVSLPTYDPNDFANGISQKKFSRLIKDPCAPLLNRAVHGSYPPGSTFKLITTSAALNEHIISPFSRFYCSGKYIVAGLPFNCFVRTGHGSIDLTECLGYSCDSVYYEIGPKLGINRLKKYANAFCIGQKTGVDLPGENAGTMPSPEWKQQYFHEKWFPGDDANSSIGQGFVSASPLQMAAATSAVVNDGIIYRPQLMESFTQHDSNGSTVKHFSKPVVRSRVPVDPGYFKYIRAGMRLAVEDGTAKSSGGAYLGMAGKTGTAENIPTVDNPQGLNHCWFTGYAPYYPYSGWKASPLVVTVFVEKSGGYGGAVAAPVAAKVLAKWNELNSSPKQ